MAGYRVEPQLHINERWQFPAMRSPAKKYKQSIVIDTS